MNRNIINLITALFILIPQYVSANIYAIVIGIDNYKNYRSLHGAVNDAKLVADSLKAIGAKKINLLLNDEASRDGIIKAWEETVALAKTGDTVFLTYSGHGTQLPERIKNNEYDGQDELYVLGNFNESGDFTKERIIDDDLQLWFSKRPDLNIILISDSCHSGTMTRSYSISANGSKTLGNRFISIGTIFNDALALLINKEIKSEKDAQLNHVTSFSASHDNETVPEVYIDNQPHGSLSWYTARGLVGEADYNNDGIISNFELKEYLSEKVRMQTDGHQHPDIEFTRDIKTVQSVKSINVSLDTNLKPINFSILSKNNPDSIKSVSNKLSGITFVEPGLGVLSLFLDDGVIRNQFNDTVYILSSANNETRAWRRKEQSNNIQVTQIGIQPEQIANNLSQESLSNIQKVIIKYQLVEKLKSESDGSLAVKLLPDDKLHPQGQTVSFEIGNLKYPYLTLVNLTVDGQIYFLYPSLQKDTLVVPVNKPFRLDDLEVTEPFGADHLLAIVTDKPLTDFHEKIKQLDNSINSLHEFVQSLVFALRDTKYQIGIHANFTTSHL